MNSFILSTQASQITVTKELYVMEFQSYVRGYHAYMDSWTPVNGQALSKREPANVHDVHAVHAVAI